MLFKKQKNQIGNELKELSNKYSEHKKIDSNIYFTGVPSPAAAGLTLLPVFIYLEFDIWFPVLILKH